MRVIFMEMRKEEDHRKLSMNATQFYPFQVSFPSECFEMY
jgi:hypothetical protein